MLRVQIIAGIISFTLLLTILELIRRRKFLEKYALLWIFNALVIFIFSLYPKLLFKIAEILGLYYLTCLFIIVFLFLLCIMLYFSTSLSKLVEQNKRLAQDLAILEFKLKEQKKSSNDSSQKDN